MRRNMWVAVFGLLVVLVVVGLGSCSTGDKGPPRVTDGMLIEDAFAGLFFPNPDGEQAVMFEGESWCIADLPAPSAVDDVLPVTVEVLSPGTPQLRCFDSLVSPDASPRWSPDGSRIAASDLEEAELYVLDPSSLGIETLDIGAGLASLGIWVSETEFLYYGFEPEEAWYVAPVDGGELRPIQAPRPGAVEPVLVGDSTVIYRTDRPGALADPAAVEVADLVELDWKAGTATTLAPVKNLNAGGQIPDPGVVTDMTSDLRYAVLWAQTKANEGQSPNVYVYDLESESLIAHTPPGLVPQTMGSQPFLVGDAWIAYTAFVSGESEPHLNVYIAPLDDPSAAIELFQDGLLVDVTNDRLTIAAASEGLAILDIDF